MNYTVTTQLDVKREILRALLRLVEDEVRQKLMLYSEARHLWRTPGKLELDDEDTQWEFCYDVGEFQSRMSIYHPNIQFGNITALRLSIFSSESLATQFAKVLEFLPIRDLGIQECSDTPQFMEAMVKVWAPALQGLLILRVYYDDYIREPDAVSLSLTTVV